MNKYKVWSGGRGRTFKTLQDAQNFANLVFCKTGEIVAITEIKGRNTK